MHLVECGGDHAAGVEAPLAAVAVTALEEVLR